MQPYGIDYSDPYPLQYPRFTEADGLNNYMYRVKNYHQALRTKFFYHCVCIKKTKWKTLSFNKILKFISDKLLLFSFTFFIRTFI